MESKMKIAITSGYFNPIHPGHIECFRLAKEVVGASHLCVIVNNDVQAQLKRGIPSFQNENDRMSIVSSIRWVDNVVLSMDTDLTVGHTLYNLILDYRSKYDDKEIIFVKGGDRFAGNTPEKQVCDSMGVKLVDGVGDKTHNSSDFLRRARNGAV